MNLLAGCTLHSHTYIRYSAKHVVHLQAYQDNALFMVVLQTRSIYLWLAGSFPKMAVCQARLFSAVILLTGCKCGSGWISCKLGHPVVAIMWGELPALCFCQSKDRFFESLTSSTLNYLNPKNRAVSMDQRRNCCKQKAGVDSWSSLMRQLKLFLPVLYLLCQAEQTHSLLGTSSKLNICSSYLWLLKLCLTTDKGVQLVSPLQWRSFYSWQEWTSSSVHENASPRSIVHCKDLLSHFAPPLGDIELMQKDLSAETW